MTRPVRHLAITLAALLLATAISASADQISFGSATYSVAEANTTLDVTVTRTSGIGAESVDYATADGTATAGVHYAGTSGTLAFADGESSKTLTLTILDETMYDLDHDFTVTLSSPTAGATLGTATTTVTITDDDDPAPTVTVTGPAEVHVGTSGSTNLLYTVSLSSTSRFPVTFKFVAEDDPAALAACQVPKSGCYDTFSHGNSNQTIPPGGTELVASVQAFGDIVYKDLTFRVGAIPTFGAQSDASYVYTHIIDDGIRPTITASDIVVPEPSSPSGQSVIDIPFTSDRPLCGRIHVSTQNGTAIGGKDYETLFSDSRAILEYDRESAKTLHVTVYNNPSAPAERSFTIGTYNDSCSEAQGSFFGVIADLPPPITVTISRQPGTPTASVRPSNLSVASDGQTTLTADLGVVASSPQELAVSTSSPCIQTPASVTVGTGQQTVAIPVTGVSGPCDAQVFVSIPPPAGAGTYTASVHVYIRPIVTFGGTPIVLEVGGTTSVTVFSTPLEQATVTFGAYTSSPHIDIPFPFFPMRLIEDGRYYGRFEIEGLSAGTFTITVRIDPRYGGGTVSVNGEVVAPDAGKTITAVTPGSGTTGGDTSVRLTAPGLGADCWAFFDGVAGHDAVIVAPDALVVTTPPHAAGPVTLTLRCNGAADRTLASGFSYLPGDDAAPLVTGVQPFSAAPGAQVTISGLHFHPSDQIAFGGVAASVVGTQPDQHVAIVPAMQAGVISIDVADDSGHRSTTGPIFTVLSEAPVIRAITPASAPSGSEILIDGAGLAAPRGFTIAGVAAAVVQRTAGRAIVRVPQLGGGSYPVTLIEPGGAIAATGGPLTVTSTGIVVRGVTPLCLSSSAGGSSIAISGSGFAGGATVTIGGASAQNVHVVDAEHITATVPELVPGRLTVTVTNPGGANGTSTDALTVRSRFDPDGCGAIVHPRASRP